jgi:hypothetical protein
MQSHHAVVAVHDAANIVFAHQHQAPAGSFWHRWFDAPKERHFADEVRAFIMALDHLLDVPPQMLTPADLVAVGEDVERVVQRVEAAIDEDAGGGTAAALTPGIYVMRARYEELYKRGV